MAKVNTNKANKISGVRVDLPDEPSSIDKAWGRRYRYVLRSDGKVLRSFQTAIKYPDMSPYWGSNNYTIIGIVKDITTFDLMKFASRRHPDAVTIIKD